VRGQNGQVSRTLLILLSLLIILAIPIGLVSSETGSRWLLHQVFAHLPAQVSVAGIQGRLIDRIALTDFRYRADADTIAFKNLVFAWQASELFSGNLTIADLAVNGLNVNLSPSKDQSKSGFDVNTELWLPLNLVIENFLLTDAQFGSGDQAHKLTKLQFSAATDQHQLKINSLVVNTPELNTALQGQVGLGKGFPIDLKTSWAFNAANNGLWQGVTTLSGDLHKLLFDNQLSTPFKLALKGHVQDLLTAPRITARGDWQKLVWPFLGTTPQLQSEQGYFELAGLLSDYQVTVNGQLNQQYLPKAVLSFNGKGSMDAMTIKKLELKSTSGVFQLMGEVNWKDAPAFDLIAGGQNFNPAIVLPEMPGSLTFSTHLKGKMAASALFMDADINKFSGHLRGHPVSANGKLLLSGDQLTINALRIASGINKLAIDGTLGQQQSTLKIALDMPALETLWPTLGGSLKGGGQLQGTWKNPTVQFNANAKRLRFAEHSAEQLAINIDYHPEAQKTSAISLSVSTLKSGAVLITKLQLEGKGSTAQHSFKADIASANGSLSTALSGQLKDQHWKGELSRLDVASRDGGSWRLKKNLPLSVAKKATGFDALVDEACLVQQDASLCVHGQYAANGDFSVNLKARALPTGLVHAYLPEQMDLTGTVNGDADIQRQKGLFAGRYQFDMPPSTLSLATTAKVKNRIALGALSLSGQIKGDRITADADLALAGQDYCRTQLQLNVGKSQTISGQVAASISEFAMIEPFLPGLANLKGRLKADLNLKGPLQKPQVNGVVDLAEGAVDTAQMGLRAINLQAVATGVNSIQLHASAVPVVPVKPGATEQLAIKTVITVDADIQQRNGGPSGHYRLALPADTTIKFKTPEASTELVLGASSLSGDINGELVSADLDMALVGQDYLRGKLQLNTGETQALSGQINSALNRFALLEPFVPQLSNIQGNLKADINVAGNLHKPQLTGAVTLTKGAADVDQAGLELRDINLQALAADEHIHIQGSAKSGTGSVKLDGSLGLQAESHWPLELTLSGENFEIAKIPEAQILISPDLKIAFADGSGKVKGLIKVPKAVLTIQDIPENAVKVSQDEIIIGEEKSGETAAVAPGIDIAIDVELGKQVSFTGLGLQTNLSGRLHIVKAEEKLAMQGDVDMIKASYKRYGQDLTVRKGRFSFNGPADNPWLDLEAIRVSKNKKVTAILGLSGPLQKPKTSISSEPALPESDALAYLITGQPLNQVSQSEGNMVAAAALSYGSGQLSWVADKLGVDVLEVEEGETLQDTLLSVGQYLTPDFYVGAKVGLFNKQPVLVLKHNLTEKITVESQTGKSQRIKLNYEIDRD